MGYDMYVVSMDEDLSSTNTYTVTDYLRRNISGQPYLRKWLLDSGATNADYALDPWPDYLGDADPWEDEDHQAEVYRYLVLTPLGFDERHGIPYHKLCDNSGWHVTKRECSMAIRRIMEKALDVPSLPHDFDHEEELAKCIPDIANIFHPDYPNVFFKMSDDSPPTTDVLDFLVTAAWSEGFRVY